MEKIKEYKNTIFPVETIKKAIIIFDSLVKEEVIRSDKFLYKSHVDYPDEVIFDKLNTSQELEIKVKEETWKYDSEDEFFADYRKYEPDSISNCFRYERSHLSQRLTVESLSASSSKICILINGNPDNRSIIEKIFDVFEGDAPTSKLPYESITKPKIFIGHGRSNLWRDLKDHLHDKQGYEIVAYEVGARAGHSIRDVLIDMLSESSFALLVMTAEDETADGQFRARQNVIHEIGLFQGRLGFNRAIILLEDGTEEFSNISGIDQIRFSKGNIKESYGDVLATIKREFY